jgi:hypothetical protein
MHWYNNDKITTHSLQVLLMFEFFSCNEQVIAMLLFKSRIISSWIIYRYSLTVLIKNTCKQYESHQSFGFTKRFSSVLLNTYLTLRRPNIIS